MKQSGSKSREILGKSISHVAGFGAVLPLMLGGTAIAAAATVHTWPAVVAMAIVLVITIVWVALGPTVTHTESAVTEGKKTRQLQLAFARRVTHGTERESKLQGRTARSDGEVDDLSLSTPAVIRAWALSEGMDVHRTGPLPRVVVEAWESRDCSSRSNEQS